MHMELMDAPDITFQALSGEEEGHNEDGEHVHEGDDYDLHTFRQAVVLGQHPNGDPLDKDMPRWQIDDEDVAQLFVYIKQLD